jgi:hypothetical protein
MLAGICFGRSGRNASADRRRGISSVSSILAPGHDFLTRNLARSRFFSAAVAQPPKPLKRLVFRYCAQTLTAQFTFLEMENIWKFRASFRARKSRLR